MEQFIRDVGRLHRLMIQLAGADLTRTETTVMGAVAERPRRITELADFVGLTQPAITGIVKSLERRGLTRRERDPGDRRAVQVELTDQGRALIDAGLERIAEAMVTSLSGQRGDAEGLIADAAAAVGVLVRALEPV